MKATVHLVYPHGDKVSCPDAIGRHLAQRLLKLEYKVRHYEWTEFRKILPGPNDVLIGHACPVAMTVFRRSCRAKDWKRVILMSPYCPGDDYQNAFNDPLIRYCDLYLAITGNYWFTTTRNTGFAHWIPKLRHLDLAVNRAEFPVLKHAFNPPGKRKILYIGRDGMTARIKNTGYLEQIAAAMPEVDFGWIGTDEPHGNIRSLGKHDFRNDKSRALLAEYDIFITVGHVDANPTTILESMAWGLIPVCTPQSGYVGYDSIVNVPLASTETAVSILRNLVRAPDAVLREKQQSNWQMLDDHFNWDRFAAQVIGAIESDESPACLPVSLKRTWEMKMAEVTSPLWRNLLSPRKLSKTLKEFTASGRRSLKSAS